jgi:PAS domain S-box-containing protein
MTGIDGSLKVNKTFCDILGYSEVELQTKKWQELTHPDDIQESKDIIQALLKGDKINARYEKRYLHKDGSIIWTDVSTTLHRDQNDNPLFFITTINDTTSRKKTEEQLKSTMQNLERSNQELEQFAYVASHDLQEPLRMVSSYTQLLERRYKDKLDQDANEFIQYAVDGATRMQKLINDLLDYSRVTSRGKEFTIVDTSQVLGQTISNLQESIIENTALITNDDLPKVKADESQILRVFQNLIQNALKFKNKSELPKIHISCKKNNDFYEFSIRDNGIGMDMQYHDRVFTIFQRLHTKEEYPGTGIGLSICKRIIERNGGKIWFESKVNEGTTFYFTLSSLSTQ